MTMLILAMVLAAGITHAYEQGKARSAARWQEARIRAVERSARREREQRERAATWAAWFDRGVSAGPQHPLWWGYTAGWATGGAIAAVGAGAVGVYSGAIAGSRGGYRVGREAGRRERKFHEAWQQWRADEPHEAVALQQCERCGGWVPANEMRSDANRGQVCPDCMPGPPVSNGWIEDVVHSRNGGSRDMPSKCANGCGSLIEEGQRLCVACQATAENQRTCRQDREEEADERLWGVDNSPESPREETPSPIYVHADRVYPETPQGKENTKTMSALMPANGGNDVAGTGEGYTDTVQSLDALARLMDNVQQHITDLTDNLTANSLDADTLTRLSGLTDQIETVTSLAQDLNRHVHERHNPMAEATASAGGSQNVASMAWYDQY